MVFHHAYFRIHNAIASIELCPVKSCAIKSRSCLVSPVSSIAHQILSSAGASKWHKSVRVSFTEHARGITITSEVCSSLRSAGVVVSASLSLNRVKDAGVYSVPSIIKKRRSMVKSIRKRTD